MHGRKYIYFKLVQLCSLCKWTPNTCVIDIFIISFESKLLIMFRGQHVIFKQIPLDQLYQFNKNHHHKNHPYTSQWRSVCVYFFLSLSIYVHEGSLVTTVRNFLLLGLGSKCKNFAIYLRPCMYCLWTHLHLWLLLQNYNTRHCCYSNVNKTKYFRLRL